MQQLTSLSTAHQTLRREAPSAPSAAPKPPPVGADQLRPSLLALIAADGRDLSVRQLAVLLTLRERPAPHTVKGLAAELRLQKPVITRALDRLAAEGLAQRLPHPTDGRSVLAEATPAGVALLAVAYGACSMERAA
jgi:DNA-binding MarR family transcriptional regulator